jgi:hypothetical protein
LRLQYWGKKDLAELEAADFKHCGLPLKDFWPKEVVRKDFEHEVTAEASCWLAMHESRVIGFCMGYPAKISEIESKLGIQFNASLGREGAEIVAYQDDVGLLVPFRDKKLSKVLLANRNRDFTKQSMRFGIVRTREFPEPSVTFSWYTTKLGYRILARYPGDDGRVILGRELEGLQELLTS